MGSISTKTGTRTQSRVTALKLVMAGTVAGFLIGTPTVLAYRTERVCDTTMTKSGEKTHCRRVVVQEKNPDHNKKDPKK